MSLRRKIYEVIEAADKDDRDSLIYDRFMLVCIAASIVPLCFKETNALFIWLDRATVTVFIVDYLLRWWTADLKYEKSGKWAFLRYPFSFFGIVDLLSILPSLTMLSSGFKLFRLFRLNKALKALKFLRYSHSFELILNVIKREKRALAAVCVLAGGYIALSALIMFQVEPDSFDTFFRRHLLGGRHTDDRRLWRHLSDERDRPHREHDVVVHGNRHRCAAHRYHYGWLHARAQP